MKNSLLLGLIVMSLALVGCGGKDNSSGSNSMYSGSNPFQSTTPTTQNGYLNLQTLALEVGSVSYPPSQSYAQVINQAIYQANQNRIQPVTHNGVQKLRARITAVAYGYNQNYTGYNYNQNQYNQYNQYQYQQQQYVGQSTLQLQSIVFY